MSQACYAQPTLARAIREGHLGSRARSSTSHFGQTAGARPVGAWMKEQPLRNDDETGPDKHATNDVGGPVRPEVDAAGPNGHNSGHGQGGRYTKQSRSLGDEVDRRR